MAKIILAPNESFEHFHSEDSFTVLLEGTANYRSDDTEYPLQQDVAVLTPPTSLIPLQILVTWTVCLIAVIRVCEGAIRKREQYNQGKSRPQQSLWSFDLMLTCLVVLTVTFFLLTVYSIIQSNLALLHLHRTNLFALKILDTASAATLFVTLLGALLVRHQFALSVLPRINYKSAMATRPNPHNANLPFETWRVEIKNTGLGAAIINRAEYMIELNKRETEYLPHAFDEMITTLSSVELVRNRDYWAKNITPGFSLSPKDDCFVFEIKTEDVEKMERLTMLLYFQGQLGDKYVREMSLMPNVG